jgi:hypothetical protein
LEISGRRAYILSAYWNMRNRSHVAKKPSKTGDIAPSKTSGVPANEAEVDAFLAQVKATPPATKAGNGRLIFAMDATMSRQPTWDAALNTQAQMFLEAGKVGGLDVQLLYFRGFGECRASKWVSDANSLAGLMTTVQCRGGHTQIRKVLKHVRKETERQKVDAVVYVGDCMEENIDQLCQLAGEVGLLGVRMFVFQEGHDPVAERAFREIARLTGGAYSRFDSSSVATLRDLLSAVAAYASGGRAALENFSGRSGRHAQALLEQLK